MSASLFTCPDCHARLRLAADWPAGKHVKCPKCKSTFALPDLEEEPKTESRVSRRRTPPIDEEVERRPRRRKRGASEGTKPATTALIFVAVCAGALLLLAGGALIVWARTKPKDEIVAGTPGPGGANPVAPNAGVRPGPAPPSVPRGTRVGNLALEIEGEDIDGNRFRLSDYQGKVVLLDFWGNW